MQSDSAWQVYPSIEHPSDVVIEQCETVAGSMTWCLTEKIHGANCSVIVPEKESEELTIASRNQILHSGQDFYNIRESLSSPVSPGSVKLSIALRQCAQQLRANKLVPKGPVVFYGEVFGGVFPKVPKVAGSKVVQHGIYYTPGNNVRFFDVCGSDKCFVAYDAAVEAMKKLSIPFVPIIAKGTFRELLQLAESTCCDVSTICTLYSLPLVDANEREGNVLKPLGHVMLKEDERCIVKVKNPRFNELIEAGVAADRKHQVKKALQPADEHAPIIKKVITDPKQHMLSFVNEPRVASVCSKMHPDDINTDNLRSIVTLMRDDVWKDLARDVDLKTISDSEQQAMRKALETRCQKVAREYVERLEEEALENEDY